MCSTKRIGKNYNSDTKQIKLYRVQQNYFYTQTVYKIVRNPVTLNIS